MVSVTFAVSTLVNDKVSLTGFNVFRVKKKKSLFYFLFQ